MSHFRSTFTACSRQLCRQALASRPLSSSATKCEAIVLSRLQADLKDALRSKNKTALTTIRALQAEIINASKTAKPIETDGALYSLIQKQIKSSNTAKEEFKAAKREDLVSKEQAQLDVLQGYADEIPKVAEGEIDGFVAAALEDGKKTFGSIMQKVMGSIKGRPFDIEYVTRKIGQAIEKK